MKVYLYDIESGVYEGEDFCADREMHESSGMTLLPPPTARTGHIIIFDRASHIWKQLPVAATGSVEDA